MTEAPAPSNSHGLVGTIVGGVVGWTFSQYCGASVWIPGAACVGLTVLFLKTRFKPAHFAGAITATGGHVVWFLLGSLIARNWSAAGLDLLFLTSGIVWLWLRPGLVPALFLGGIQMLSVVLNGVTLAHVSFGSLEHRALTAHVLFRVIALTCLGVGYWRFRRTRIAQSQQPAPAPDASPLPAPQTPVP